MAAHFSDAVRRAMAQAELIARRWNHEYVGTEHLLLSLIGGGNGVLERLLDEHHLTADQLRAAIEAMVQPGTAKHSSLGKLPLTPRARHAIELAAEDLAFLQQEAIGPEHLLLGLLREPDGVAGQALRSLGVDLKAAADTIYRERLEQLKFVERIVRPVRVGYLRKRKMREELLSHLTAIFDDELTRSTDSGGAWQSALLRFGEPAELARELEESLPLREHVNFWIESWIGWRPPEPATRWMARAALQTAALLAVLNVVAATCFLFAWGWSSPMWMAIRAIGAMSLLIPLTQFALGSLHFQVRDAMFGAFGARRSTARAVLLAALMGITSCLACLAFVPIGNNGTTNLVDAVVLAVVPGLCVTIFVLLFVRANGPQEIRDTLWATLELSEGQNRGEPPVEPAG